MAFHLCLNLNFLCTGFLGYGEEIRKCSQSPREGKQEGLNDSHHYVIWMGWKWRLFYLWSDQIRSPNLAINAACSPKICLSLSSGCCSWDVVGHTWGAVEWVHWRAWEHRVRFWKWLSSHSFSFLAVPQLCHSLKRETTAERPFLTPHFLLFLSVSPSTSQCACPVLTIVH